ncbi:beta-1,4-N-acetylgalactosaminyltransferase bre-4-like [Achroia grisella]|uniref:beta-1,4-N-acetylgalactosaminyltransferase bre-4-like n=1 Tax=Achroia grisella TaxID=688607 RepID=UPI0027D28617|nr:beta-1,4-N-acetylgalactosaminyltransferase bre-4-like [Achroia grisella]
MARASLESRILHLRICCFVMLILCLIGIVQMFASYGKYDYPHTARVDLSDKLFTGVTPFVTPKKSVPDCTYDKVLENKKSYHPSEVARKHDNFSPKGIMNGSYTPEECNPLFSVAVLVTYRKRQNQLDTFVPYMHDWLRKQHLHYKIYVIEQQDEKPWNKGMLYNIGAKYAIADKFPCLILHDVDLLPLDEGNLYVCMKEPRHMSASIDKFRFVLTYDTLVGGVLAMRSEQYLLVNGFSNRFQGWGGEDDDFAERIHSRKLSIQRFPREMSEYTMLLHHPEPKNSDRARIMYENKQHISEDGLNSVMYESVQVKPQRLFTLIQVKL